MIQFINQKKLSIFSHATQIYFKSRRTAVTKVVVVGSGWGGYGVIQALDKHKYEVICVSPQNHFVFTPLLASSAVGTLEYRAIVESVRRKKWPNLSYHQAVCKGVNFTKKFIKCSIVPLPQGRNNITNFDDNTLKSTEINYDKLILAPGAESHTFGISGVRENAYFLKNISDARAIRSRIIYCFDAASHPTTSEEDILRLMNFVIVGGGPTGVEFSAELHDFILDDLSKIYPKLSKLIRITLFDVAPRILGGFDGALASYAEKRFSRIGVNIRINTRVNSVHQDFVEVNEGEKIPYGLLVWATGITQTPLIQGMLGLVANDPLGRRRLVTDKKLCLLSPKNEDIIPDVYALGDCSTILDYELPATAQVASQKAKYLTKQLNSNLKSSEWKPFGYKHMGSMAYIGEWRAIIDLPANKYKISGYIAWFLWRSVYLSKSLSLRNKILIPFMWLTSWLFGREISKI